MKSSLEAGVTAGTENFVKAARPFFAYLKEWEAGLETVPLDALIHDAGGADRVVVVVEDMLEGFCRTGPLASDRVKNRIAPIVDLLNAAHKRGVRHFALVEDSHREDTPEFGAYPPHCVAGTEEAETVREIKALPFFDSMKRFPKNSLSVGIDTGFSEWVSGISPRSIVVVGDCTDLCVYQAAMFLRCLANQRGYDWDVVVPADAVDTYDLPVDTAKELGAPAHPGDFFHAVYLYHLFLNGVRVVRGVRKVS